jgi:hypothetical protein
MQFLDELKTKYNELDSLKKAHEALIASTKDLEAKTDQKITKAYAQIDKTSKKYKSLLEEFNELQKKYREMEAQSEIYKTSLNEERTSKLQMRLEVEGLQKAKVISDQETAKKVKKLQDEIDALRRENEKLQKDYSSTQALVVGNDDKFQQLTEELNQLRTARAITFNATYVTNTNVNNQTVNNTYVETIINNTATTNVYVTNVLKSDDIENVRNEFISQLKRMDEVRVKNVKLLDRIFQLTNNIQVTARTRPPNEEENQSGSLIIDSAGGECGEVNVYESKDNSWTNFEVDSHWAYDASQAEVFADVEPIITTLIPTISDILAGNSILSNKNKSTTVLTYGSKSTGKSFTMFGVGEHIGIAFRAIQKLFELLDFQKTQLLLKRNEQDKKQNGAKKEPMSTGNISPETLYEHSVTLSIMEVVEGNLFDVLQVLDEEGNVVAGSTKNDINLADRIGYESVNGENGVEVKIAGLKHKGVLDVNTALKHVASTLQYVNERKQSRSSSSSSIVIELNVAVKVNTDGTTLKSKLVLGDLAPSSYSTKGETVDVNIAALDAAMKDLEAKGDKASFDKCVLTKLLKPSFVPSSSVQSRLMMIYTLAPSNLTIQATKTDLAKAVALRKIQRNVGGGAPNSVMAAEVKTMEMKLKTTTTQLREAKTTIQTVSETAISTKRLAQEVITKLNAGNTTLTQYLQEEKELSKQLQSDLTLTQRNLKKAISELSEQRKANEKLVKLVRGLEEERSTNNANSNNE